MKVEGSCHCGQITFEAEIDPERVRICHCKDCQRLSGAAFRITAPTAEADFRLLSGRPREYVKIAESGARRIQTFCGDCGSPIYATSAEGENRTFGIRVGSLAQRDQLAPRRQFWSRSRLPWLPEIAAASTQTQ